MSFSEEKKEKVKASLSHETQNLLDSLHNMFAPDAALLLHFTDQYNRDSFIFQTGGIKHLVLVQIQDKDLKSMECIEISPEDFLLLQSLEAEEVPYYKKLLMRMSALWNLLEDAKEVDEKLASIPDEIKEKLYAHPLVKTYDLLP